MILCSIQDQNKLIEFVDIVSNLFSLDDFSFYEVIGLGKLIVSSLIEQHSQHSKSRLGSPSSLSPASEVMLLLIYLTHGIVDALLGILFNTSRRTIGNIRHKMINIFYNRFKNYITMHSLEWRLKHSIKMFHTTYTFLLDGTHQQVNGSDDPFRDTEFYSTKKGMHTINVLVVISAIGKKILYISPSMPGSYNDPQILTLTKQDWYDKLDPMEHGLGDRIFKKPQEESNFRVDIPPSERNDLYRVMAKARASVENIMADIKDWSALSVPLRIPPKKRDYILEYHHKIWTIVASFTNIYK